MQKGEALQTMETDLEEVVSIMKKKEYERALCRANDAIDLRVIELHVRTDSRLSQGHRIQLLNRVEAALSGPPLLSIGALAARDQDRGSEVELETNRLNSLGGALLSAPRTTRRG